MLKEITNKEILTWDEIKKKYPRQWACMEVIEWYNSSNIKTAIVRYVSDEKPSLCELQEIDPNIIRRKTNPDEGFEMGAIT